MQYKGQGPITTQLLKDPDVYHNKDGTVPVKIYIPKHEKFFSEGYVGQTGVIILTNSNFPLKKHSFSTLTILLNYWIPSVKKYVEETLANPHDTSGPTTTIKTGYNLNLIHFIVKGKETSLKKWHSQKKKTSTSGPVEVECDTTRCKPLPPCPRVKRQKTQSHGKKKKMEIVSNVTEPTTTTVPLDVNEGTTLVEDNLEIFEELTSFDLEDALKEFMD